MDSITHIALGACLGEAMMHKSLGKKALILGAMAQSFPDLDIIGSLFLSPGKDLLAHRGFSHSLLFALLAGLLFSFVCLRWYRARQISFLKLFIFFFLQLSIHDLLDTCNSYGTGLLEPFTHQRFSINLLYVADPIFSIWLVIAALVLFISKKSNPNRIKWVLAGVLPSIVYLCFAAFDKLTIRPQVEKSLQASHINYADYFSTPTPFNSLLWYIVVASDTGYFIGYRSVFDKRGELIPFAYFPRNERILRSVDIGPETENLIRFADGYYTIEEWNGTIVFNVLRFGQILGWQYPRGHFVFHYFLNPMTDNSLVVQRGRLEGWNKKTISTMIERILGKMPKY
jgi:inner membrane protein